jgi:hypothetical protein
LKQSIHTFLLLVFAVLPGTQGIFGQDRGFGGGISSSSAVTLDSTNLPLIIIDTHGQTIVDESKITAHMKVIYHGPSGKSRVTDPGNIYDGSIGIEIRGSFSASLPQKPYGFETRDSLGDNFSVPLLDMPPENDWILLANYNDKVFMRNTLAFDLFSKMGHYQPHTRLCEVIVNNDYQGIYVLTEKIKQDNNRVNISKLTAADTLGDDCTGGYIIKMYNSDGSDGWRSRYEAIDCPGTRRYPYFVYCYPKPEDILPRQKQYIQEFVITIDSILRNPRWADPEAGYGAYLDVASFVDYFIIGEVSRNVDTYKKSAFFYKDKNSIDGRLHVGPVWDFDWAWKNMWGECNAASTDGSGWTYKISSDCHTYPVPPGWMAKLLEDTAFTDEIHTRYSLLRESLLSEDYFYRYIDSIYTLVNEAQVRHYQRWPILGGPSEGAPEMDEQPTTFDGEIIKFINWITTRLSWLDVNMPGSDTQGTGMREMAIESEKYILMQNFPNPFNPVTAIHFSLTSKSYVSLKIFNALGEEVTTLASEVLPAGSYLRQWKATEMPSGIYFCRLQAGFSVQTKKLVLIK